MYFRYHSATDSFLVWGVEKNSPMNSPPVTVWPWPLRNAHLLADPRHQGKEGKINLGMYRSLWLFCLSGWWFNKKNMQPSNWIMNPQTFGVKNSKKIFVSCHHRPAKCGTWNVLHHLPTTCFFAFETHVFRRSKCVVHPMSWCHPPFDLRLQ